MDIIGLTGGIACGKSTVAQMLRDKGVLVVDADQVAREVVEPGSEGLADIVAAFGPGVLDDEGALDRPALGEKVFADAALRGTLNGIVHPRVAQRSMELFQQAAAAGHRRAVYEVPLLYENGLEAMMQAVIVVAVDDETQLARLMARDGSEAPAAQARIDSQMSLSEKKARADFIIDNSGDRAATQAQLDQVWSAIEAGTTPAS